MSSERSHPRGTSPTRRSSSCSSPNPSPGEREERRRAWPARFTVLPYGVLSRLHKIRTRIEPAFRRAIGRSAPSWTREPNTLPWFDQPDAHARIAGDPQAALLRRWIDDGWVVVDDMVDVVDIDAMVATLDGLWDAAAPIPHLTL